MFIISFAIFIFVLTVFENIFLAILLLILILLWYWFFYKFKKIQSAVLFVLLAFFISLISVFVKNYSFNQKIETLSNSTWIIYQDMDGPQWKYFIGTWVVSDIYSYQKYVFEDNSNREYFLNSSNKYQIGDIIWLNWYVSLAYTWSKNIFDIDRQWQNFTQKPEFSGFFNYEFNYPKRLMMKGFYGTIYEQSSVNLTEVGVISTETQWSGQGELQSKIETPGGEVSFNSEMDLSQQSHSRWQLVYNISFIQKIRKSLQKSIIEAYWENPKAGLILGMLVGDRSQIPPDEYQWFIDSGLVHIIAVSGWNIIMIVVFLWAILFFIPFYARNALILASIILYATICGMDSSVFRATIMWWLWMLALFRWREINIRRAMSIAFIFMLLINPYFLSYDVWFLLSFSAIIGIVYFGKFVDGWSSQDIEKSKILKNGLPRWRSQWQKRLNKFTKDFMTPTIWATLGVLPIMLFFMWKTNLTWIIANFLVVPIVAIVMIYWFISTMLFQIIPREIRLRPEKILLNYIYAISDLAVKWWVYLQADWAWIKYVLLWLFVIWVIIKRKDDKIS